MTMLQRYLLWTAGTLALPFASACAQSSSQPVATHAPSSPTGASIASDQGSAAPAGQASADAAARVSVAIESATAKTGRHGLQIRAQVTLHNRTAGPLQVRSNFFSAFDGLTMIVVEKGGQELGRQHYTYHQSPCAEDQSFPLPLGRTTHEMVFPLETKTVAVGTRVELQVVGGLPGTAFTEGLSSNVVSAEVTPDPLSP